jgi:hypothetical protein
MKRVRCSLAPSAGTHRSHWQMVMTFMVLMGLVLLY